MHFAIPREQPLHIPQKKKKKRQWNIARKPTEKLKWKI